MHSAARLEYLEREYKFNKHIIARQNEEIARLTEECQALKDTIASQNKELKYLRNKDSQRCGTCIYAKPTVWGRSKVHVECTNQEHLGRYCSNHESTKIRPRNTYACKCYVERTDKTNE